MQESSIAVVDEAAPSTQPRAVAASVRSCLEATPPADRVARAELHRQAAMAALDLDDARIGLDEARRAVRLASTTGDRALEGRCRTALARALAWGFGRLGQALAEIDRAAPLLHGADRGRLELQRTVALYKTGDHVAALDAANHALRLVPAGSPDAARVLNNRGVIRLYVGGFDDGLADLRQARETYLAAGMSFAAAEVRTNVGMMLDRLGDVAGALTELAEAEDDLRSHEVPVDRDTIARAEVLLRAGLYDDVLAIVPGSVTSLEAAGMHGDADEGRYYLAEALVLAGSDQAAAQARAARVAFTRSRRWGWSALARLAEVKARLDAGEATPSALRAARETALALGRAGLAPQEREAWLVAGRFATRAGRSADAIDHWSRAGRPSRHATLSERLSMVEARARLFRLLDDPAGALRACDRGLRLLEEHVVALGATDLRASASDRGVTLARIAVDVAWARAHPRMLLHWVERWRAAALWLAPVRPPPDAALAGLLAELRAATTDARRPTVDNGSPDGQLARARVAALERAVQVASRRPTKSTPPVEHRRATARDVLDLLGERAMVELIQHGGRLGALVLAAGRSTFHELGPLAPIAAHSEAVRFTVRRVAHLGAGAMTDLAIGNADTSLSALRGALIEPLRRRITDRELVVVPDLDLHHLPWSLILRDGRPTSVAPSASLWRRAMLTPTLPDRHVTVIAGPRLAGADEEARRVARHHPGALLFRGAQATVEAVGAALDGAAVAHIAAHGTIRRDNPLFSGIELADGLAMVHDLEHIGRSPSLIVLASCNSTVGQLHSGNDVIGLAAALLSAGARTIIGAAVPLPDVDIVEVMVGFHARLAAGAPPATALADAIAVECASDRIRFAAGGALVCYGAG